MTVSWLGCWHREKKGSKKQPRDVFLDLVFKRFQPVFTWRLDALQIWVCCLLCEQEQKPLLSRGDVAYAVILPTMANTLCAGSTWPTKDSQELLVSSVWTSVLLLRAGFHTHLLPSSPERNFSKAFGQKEKKSYQHTPVPDSFSTCICISIYFKSERQ